MDEVLLLGRPLEHLGPIRSLRLEAWRLWRRPGQRGRPSQITRINNHHTQPQTAPHLLVVSSARLLCVWLRFSGRHGSLDITVDRRKGLLDTTGPPWYHEIQSTTSNPTHSCCPQRVWDGLVGNPVPKYKLVNSSLRVYFPATE